MLPFAAIWLLNGRPINNETSHDDAHRGQDQKNATYEEEKGKNIHLDLVSKKAQCIIAPLTGFFVLRSFALHRARRPIQPIIRCHYRITIYVVYLSFTNTDSGRLLDKGNTVGNEVGVAASNDAASTAAIFNKNPFANFPHGIASQVEFCADECTQIIKLGVVDGDQFRTTLIGNGCIFFGTTVVVDVGLELPSTMHKVNDRAPDSHFHALGLQLLNELYGIFGKEVRTPTTVGFVFFE